MQRVLITGATGNTGFSVIRWLRKYQSDLRIIAAVRNIEKDKTKFSDFDNIGFRRFDFEKEITFDKALNNINIIFLLRPPHISDIDRYFRPLFEVIRRKGIRKIVFLSVQGADKSKMIPHSKIEHLIIENELEYIFLRPSYFMQNLTTNLIDDIRLRNRIYLPAADARLNWIDVENIAETAAIMISEFDKHRSQTPMITGPDNLTFREVADLLTEQLGRDIDYISPGILRFFFTKKKEGHPAGKILVMIMLHYLPRFQSEPELSNFYETLTGKKLGSLREFISREIDKFE